MNVSDCRLIDLPKFLDKRGNLSFAEEFKHIPFKIERTYWIYDVPGGEKRGGHAYKEKQIWRQMDNFSTNSLALILSSTPYGENDYIRDYETFKNTAL